ncbi:MAG: DUF1573 domain-containing protein [Pirellulales bacterium]|nr:DUF1573 domain-containing protein [Pirellulales bacterium]
MVRLWIIVVFACFAVALGSLSLGWSKSGSRPPQEENTAVGGHDVQTGPRALVDQEYHSLGVVDPSQPCEHTFFIRNAGDAPLEITKGGTSCRCTVSVLPAQDIPPGRRGPVKIASNVLQVDGDFVHTATVLTNDPRKPTITLTIAGAVKRRIGASPAAIVLSNLRPGDSASVESTIYSQAWPNFIIENVKSSLEGLQWELRPAPADSLQQLKAKSGYQCRMTLPGNLPFGPFRERLTMTVRSEQSGAETRVLELPVSGSVLGRRTVYGQKINSQGVVGLGPLRAGEGAETQLTMNIRDEPRCVRVLRVEKEPGFLVVAVAPYRPGTDKAGIYRVDVRVPPDAPACNYMGTRAGKLKIVLDHPTVPEIDLKLEFAVLSQQILNTP